MKFLIFLKKGGFKNFKKIFLDKNYYLGYLSISERMGGTLIKHILLHCETADFRILKCAGFKLKIWSINIWQQKLITMPRKHIGKYFISG